MQKLKERKSFYSTYEELKRQQRKQRKLFLCSFYSTYEELKQDCDALDRTRTSEFLQYLWGIETTSFHAPQFFLLDRFLQYLWGIETSLFLESSSKPIRFYSTYEELKQHSKTCNSYSLMSFYSTYEELKQTRHQIN